MAVADIDGAREGYADLGEVRLRYFEAGDGPLVVLLHGFPETALSWRLQLPALAAAGFRVVAPDMRGYGGSSRPDGVSAYESGRLAHDVHDLIRERGAERALLAGHDWGGAVAWVAAISHPQAIERLAILNAPHPRRMLEGLRRPSQLMKSWYMLFFQLPWLPERALAVGRWRGLRQAFESDARPGAYERWEIERYVEEWERPGAMTAMLNYYRAMFRGGPGRASGLPPVAAPTLVLWGERDRYLGPDLAEPYARDVPRLERVVRFPEASHWLHHDEPEQVNRLLDDFFAGRPVSAD